MSKASEYAKMVKAAKARPMAVFTSGAGSSTFEVTDEGFLAARGSDLAPWHVQDLIAWLQATFGDAPPVNYTVAAPGVHDASGACDNAAIRLKDGQ